jgi:hypothetical protein
MDQQTVDDLAQRLAVLEREHRNLTAVNRRMKKLGTAVIIAFTAVFAMGLKLPGHKKHKVVEAENFIIRDASGNIRGALGIADDGSVGLNMNDSKGNTRISLDIATNDTPGLDFYDAAGHARAMMALGLDGGPGLGFYDEAGKLRTSLDVASPVSPGLGFYDATGKGTFGVP